MQNNAGGEHAIAGMPAQAPDTDSDSDRDEVKEFTGGSNWWSLPTANKILFPTVLFFLAYDVPGPSRSVYLLEAVGRFNTEFTEVEIQSTAAVWDLQLRLAESISVLFSLSIWGGISDHKGRIPALVYQAVMLTIGRTFWAVFSYYWTPLSYLFVPQIILGLSGNWPLNLVLAFAYSADTSNPKDKQKNFGRVEAACYAGAIAAPFMGGFLYQHVGRWVPWTVSAAMFALTTVIYACLPEPLLPNKRTPRIRFKNLNPIGLASIFFERKHRIYLLLVLVLGYSSRKEYSVFQFYLLFMFDKVTPVFLGALASFGGVLRILVCLFFIPFTKRFNPKWHSMFNTRVSIAAFTFAALLVVLLPVLDSTGYSVFVIMIPLAFASIMILCIREMMSTAVEPHRQAVALGAIGLLEAFMNVGIDPIFEGIWAATVGTFPGAVFIIGAGLSFITFCLTYLVEKDKLAKIESIELTEVPEENLPEITETAAQNPHCDDGFNQPDVTEELVARKSNRIMSL